MSTPVESFGVASCFKPCCGDDERPSSFQQHFGITKDNDVEATLVEGMKNLTFDQLQREQEDFHGVAQRGPEDPDQIEELLHSLDEHLNRIKHETVYDSAESKNRDYVSNRDFRMLFLTGNRYDAKAAAEQMIRHFKVKHKLFGDDCLTRDITTQDLVEEDVQAVLSGMVQISCCPDSSGRTITFGFPGKRPADVPLINQLRLCFFHGMKALTNSIEDNTKGAVLVSYSVDEYRETKYDAGHMGSMEVSLAIPCNIAGYHFCFSDRAHCIIAHTAVSLMPASLRAKTKIHYGSHFECQYLLSTYGIPREAFPFKRPTNELDPRWPIYWLQQCREKELLLTEKEKPNHEPSSSSISNKHANDTNSNNINLLDSHVQQDEDSTNWSQKLMKMPLLPGEEQMAITEPNPNDVLAAGSKKIDNAGNERLRVLVMESLEAYHSGSNDDKIRIVDRIIDEIRGAGGRFLKLENGVWNELSAQKTRRKITQRFRNHTRRREIVSKQAREVGNLILDQPRPEDVIFGRGSNNRSKGTELLYLLIKERLGEYEALDRTKKYVVVESVMDRIKSEGGRFLQPSDMGGHVELSAESARDRISTYFRNQRRSFPKKTRQ